MSFLTATTEDLRKKYDGCHKNQRRLEEIQDLSRKRPEPQIRHPQLSNWQKILLLR